MNVLEDIIQRCHTRHAESDSLRQRKTVITLAMYKLLPYQIKVHCARANLLTTEELKKAKISIMPLGHATENEHFPQDFGGYRFKRQQEATDWSMRQWKDSWGIQIYTGIPSEHIGARWHDFEFKYAAICDAPDAVATCIETLLNTTANPLLTLTKSGGLRFSCRIQDYLHPNTDAEKFFIYKWIPIEDNLNQREIYLEVRGDKGYSPWDTRYEILLGNLLAPPVIAKEVVFAPINKLRDALHEPETPKTNILKTTDVCLPDFSSANLDLAKEAFIKRGFAYTQETNGFYYWSKGDTYVLMWEDRDVVWVRAATPNTEIPTRAVQITDIWKDTDISSKTQFSEKIAAIRKGELSPLAIKRLPPKLQKSQAAPKQYQSLKNQQTQIQQLLKRDPRILVITTSDADLLLNTVTELMNNNTICLNIACRSLAETAAERYITNSQTTITHYKSRMYRWELVKDIPANIRMKNPFQHGNMCEDPERCKALELKGGDPRKSLCPNCPVYTACKERGFLSQPLTLQSANAKISATGRLFLDPQYADLLQHTLNSEQAQQDICIIDERKTSIENLFVKYVLFREVIEGWSVNWRGKVLGNFAVALLNVIETSDEPYSNPISQVRTAVEAFKQHEDEIIKQMCYINVQGRVVERKMLDTETKNVLAHFAIDFKEGGSAYIPLDTEAEERLQAMGLPTLSPRTFTPNEDISIPIDITQAIALGILDVRTVEKIESFPTVCPDPDWTYWHRLKHFFTHYPRDADAPMQWDNRHLIFWLPPQLHPKIKRLLFTTTFHTEQQLRRIFPNENMDVIHVEPTAWKQGNKIFQIRTSSKSKCDTQNYNSYTNRMELTKIGERYLIGIRAEIEKDENIKHAIITNISIANKLQDLIAKPNVCFANFKTFLYNNTNYNDINLETAQVLWIIGTPRWQIDFVLQHARLLFRNHEKPLNYDEEIWADHYKDERIQETHHQKIVGLLTHIVGRAGLNRSNGKTIMLLSNYELPDITDRPETRLFDWEDFEIAGGLDKLEDAIRIREQFEAERDKLNADSNRKEVERVLGCSSRQANRVLNKLRGGNIPRVPFREQILFLLSSGREKTTASLVAAIDSSPQAIGNELKRLLDEGKIIRLRRGVYTLPEFHRPNS